MGQSTDGEISYGILFDEDTEFPWNAEQFENDIDNWWVEGVHGFKHSFEMFDEQGAWLPGFERDKAAHDRYYGERRAFEKALPPLPVELVNVCHIDHPQYVLAVRGTVKTANRGYPKKFAPAELVVSDEQRAALLGFCAEHGIEPADEPSWWLSSYWG